MDSRTEPHSPEHSDDENRPATPLSLDTRSARPARHLANSDYNAVQTSVDLASVMTATSSPVSPGSSNPALPQARTQDFVPPTRPSSTPFPQPEQRTDDLCCFGCPDGMEHGEDFVDDHDGPLDVDMGMRLDAGVDMHMQHGVDLAGKAPAQPDMSGSPRSVAMDLLDLNSLDREGEPEIDYFKLASSTIAKEPQDLSIDMDISGLPVTPTFSPITSVATSPSTLHSHFGSDLDHITHNDISKDKEQKTESATSSSCNQTLSLQDLPIEIQELILDRVFDCRVSPMTKSWPDKRLTRMATFTRVWRMLIQKRLYCRIKIKATGFNLISTMAHFGCFPHLRSYVRHVELWFPVFQPRVAPPALSAASMVPTLFLDGLSNATYTLPANNCSLEEAFLVLGAAFPNLSVLTLEGGERKKAPQVQHFAHDLYNAPAPSDPNSLAESSADLVADALLTPSVPQRPLPQLTTVRTLVCKGQWNLIRSQQDFQNIAAALPNLSGWQAVYSKPKSKSYLTMATILPHIPDTTNLTSLNLCIEGDYRQEISFPPYFLKVMDKVHFCSSLAAATPALMHLSYTGRVCRTFFDVAARIADPRTTRLKSVELTVKNCCRQVSHWHESGSGVTDLNFIRAFEALVLSAVRSLDRLTKLEHLRIRYVDLEFPVPPLNPFFLLHNGYASGVWSETIVSELSRVRPDVQWEELSESIGERTLSKDGRLIINAEFPKKRVVSLKLSNYAFLVALATI
ncbi:hypothetical protein HMPREF1624_03890 [Sporothrix schenckii ATCC 58251]|uniref:Uncharacterized protein n=1 Tax=Sporothrix schenckii (strain ATCC 58251 / de Perez 2211183) TaxID=1391915 RepID=U7Q028_SPOS1|nr:hypothetical protein HMPREF1624_03890 [Sporothrix schenckii ATCC 58251]